jgi:aspartate/methionine/tyrosine aminotransferase
MFSDKINYNTEVNTLSKILLDKKNRGIEVFDLTESNPTKAGFIYNTNEILNSIAKPDSMQYNPDPKGIISARSAVKKYYADMGLSVKEDNIFITSSTSEAYSYIFKLITNPYDKILFPSPGYPLFSFIAEMESVTIKNYKLKYSNDAGYRIDFKSLESGISDRTKAIVLVNPNNPTGNYLDKADRAELLNICKSKNLSLICDEVFLDYSFKADKRNNSTASIDDVLTFTLSGISKICGLPQFKLSWIIISGRSDLCDKARAGLEIISDTFLSVGTPIQLGIEGILKGRNQFIRQVSERTERNYSLLTETFNGSKHTEILPVEGGWYAVIKISDSIDEEKFVCGLLENENVYVHPGYFFDIEIMNCLVISLLTKTEIFKKGIEIIKKQTENLI